MKKNIVLYVKFFLILASALFALACSDSNDGTGNNKDITLYINSVSGSDISNNVIFTGNAITEVPALTWGNEGTVPQQWLVLMYKRGSDIINWMSIVDGATTSLVSSAATRYVNTIDSSPDFPVEYRISITRIEKGDWKPETSSASIAVTGDLTANLDAQSIIDIARSGEQEYTLRTNGIFTPSSGAKEILDADLTGVTAGIPLIKMPTGFTLSSSALENGETISYRSKDASNVYAASACVGYLGKSTSPPLSWVRNGAGNGGYVILAYDPIQREPNAGISDLSSAVHAPYFALWFQYNIPISTTGLVEGAGSGTGYDDHNPTPTHGKLSQNVYSQATNPLNSFYNTCNGNNSQTFRTRVRYDGPVPNPYSGRHYIRFLIFEVNSVALDVFKDASNQSLEKNRAKSLTKRTELSEYNPVGSAVDELVMNFIDWDRLHLRQNNTAGSVTIPYNGGQAQILGASIMLLPMDSPPLPF